MQWFDGIKPAGTLIYAGTGAITIPGNFLSLGLHHLWTTVSFPNSCVDSSGVYDVFLRKCCLCNGSSWAFRQYSLDNGATYQNWTCGNQEIAIGCDTLIVNAAYNCAPSGCAGTVTGQVLDNMGNVILNIPSLPYTYIPTPGSNGSIYIKLIGWCDGVKCDSCTKPVYYNCPIPEPPCGCDTAFHFTGVPTIVIPHVGEGFNGGGTVVPLVCGTTYPNNLYCQTNYQFYINYQHPWPSGNCQTMVLGEVLLNGNVVYTQNNISQANPLNYAFPAAGTYCIRFKLIVNGIVCEVCTVCFTVLCDVPCNCKEEFHFTGNPVIIANLPNPNNPVANIIINFPPPITCNTTLVRPLMCNTSYSFYVPYANPYTLPCIAKDSAVIVQVGNPVPLVINPNTSIGNPISYTFTVSGTYCVKHYLVVNGQICQVCSVCFTVDCPPICNCNAFDFLSEPTINFTLGTIRGLPVLSSLHSPCETSMATPLQCRRQYKFFISAGAIGAQLPAGCVATVKATLTLNNNVVITTFNNVTQANPLIYTFTRAGIYCIKYELFVNGILCKTCTQCFQVNCCPINYTLPVLKGNFIGCTIGGTTHIYNDSTGGTFTSLDTTVAKVDNNGNVTAVGYGRAIIVYDWTRNPCDYYVVAEYVVPVLTPLPAITGSAAICKVGDSTKLSNAGVAGIWTSSDPTVANVTTGTTKVKNTYVKAVSSGMVNITYSIVQSGCPVTTSKEVMVHNIVMDPITGPGGVCKGRTISLENTTTIPGNFSSQWLSLNTRATVDNNGVVAGVTAGAAKIRYKLNYSSPAFGTCSSSTDRDITVYALPAIPTIAYVVKPVFLVTATNTLCMNKTFTLKGTPAGGIWSSAGAVTVTGNGVVTTSSPGTGNVTYTVFNSFGCSSSKTITYDVVTCNSFSNTVEPIVLSRSNSNVLHPNAAPALPNTSNRIMLYPNPAHTKVFFNVDATTGEGLVVLADVHGKELKRVAFNTGLNSVETGIYASGVYLVTFITKYGSQTEKLVIE